MRAGQSRATTVRAVASGFSWLWDARLLIVIFTCLVDAFAAGRSPSALAAPFEGSHLLFAAELFDEQSLVGAKFSHCTFANVSFLRSKFQRGSFRNCVFVECYFRTADLRGISFVGCKFINCNFTHVTIRDCDFRYAEFRGTVPPFGELEHSAPQQPNLRHELFESLARVADAAGDGATSRRYRIAGIEALDKHLRAAVRAETDWYKKHYDALGRMGAGARFLWHQVNRVLWQHGESAWRLFASAMTLALILFPILFLVFQSGITISGDQPTAPDLLWLSLSNFLLLDRLSNASLDSWGVQSLAAVEALLGIIFAGMYVTLLIKALLRR